MNTSKTPKIWDPKSGLLVQGDICFMALPQKFTFDKSMPVDPEGGTLIIARGEVTGHHHGIPITTAPVAFRDDGLARAAETAAAAPPQMKAALYKDSDAIKKLQNEGLLTTDRLAIGILEIEGDFATLYHDEHDPVKIPPGKYYVGNQREFDAAEERRVAD